MARFSEPGQCQRTEEQEDATLAVDREHGASSQWLLLTVLLQLVEPKFRPHPLSFASRPTLQIDEKRPPRPGNRSRTVGDGQIISRLDSPAVIFVSPFSVCNMHSIRSW